MAGLSYTNQAEKDADKLLLEKCRKALLISPMHFRIDECGLWNLAGKRGRITTWGDGQSYLLHIYEREGHTRLWTNIKHELGFAEITQNAMDGGVFRFRLPLNPIQTATIRHRARFRREASEERKATLRALAAERGLGAQKRPLRPPG